MLQREREIEREESGRRIKPGSYRDLNPGLAIQEHNTPHIGPPSSVLGPLIGG